jgi:uracil-DNA glycosylase
MAGALQRLLLMPPREPKPTAAPLVPPTTSLARLKAAAADCRACELWKSGTQTVFGEGPRSATIVMIGEQPGDQEDLAGKPFVGPAGKLLDKALAAAGIERDEVFVTNAVKHFKWEPRGKKRIHKKPNAVEITACRPWLDAEMAAVHPAVIVCLGATAAQALLGRSFKVTHRRGDLIDSELARFVIATVHPSSILRAPDSERRRLEMEKFVADLQKVRETLEELGVRKQQRRRAVAERRDEGRR